MKSRKNIVIIMIIMISMITLNAIIIEKKLHNELIKYANSLYGSAICINYIINDNNVEADMKDKDTGITYSITCNNDSKIESNFDINYIAYIESKITDELNLISKKYDCKYIWSTGETLISIEVKRNNKCKTVAEKVAREIRNNDIKKYFKNKNIKMTFNDKTVGIYGIYTKKYEDSNSKYNDLIMTAYDILKNNYNIDIKDPSELKYVKSEKVYRTEIPGIDPSKIDIRIDDISSNNKKVDIIYFDIGGEHWLIADCLVSDDKGNTHLFVNNLK